MCPRTFLPKLATTEICFSLLQELSHKLSEAVREKKKIYDENIDLKQEVEKLRSLNKQLLSDDKNKLDRNNWNYFN